MRSELFGAFLLFLMGDFLDFSQLYSTLFHLQPFRFHCVGGTRKISNSEIIHAPLIGAPKPSCANGDADQIWSANYKPYCI
jgi:hypothetical protein